MTIIIKPNTNYIAQNNKNNRTLIYTNGDSNQTDTIIILTLSIQIRINNKIHINGINDEN